MDAATNELLVSEYIGDARDIRQVAKKSRRRQRLIEFLDGRVELSIVRNLNLPALVHGGECSSLTLRGVKGWIGRNDSLGFLWIDEIVDLYIRDGFSGGEF